MKNIFKLLALGLLTLMVSCDKEPDLRMPEVQDAFLPYISIVDADFTSVFDATVTDPAYITLDLGIDETYTKTTAKSYDLRVMYTNVDKEVTIGTVITDVQLGEKQVTVQEIAAAVGIDPDDLQLGEVVYFGMDAHLTNGMTIVAFRDGATAYSSSVLNIPGVSPAVRYAFNCKIDVNLLLGTFNAVSADWGANMNVTVEAAPDADLTDLGTPYKMLVHGMASGEGLQEDAPLVLYMDLITLAVTAEKTKLSPDLGPWGLPQYTGYSIGGDGFYASCDGVFTLNLEHTVDQGSFGKQGWTLTKN